MSKKGILYDINGDPINVNDTGQFFQYISEHSKNRDIDKELVEYAKKLKGLIDEKMEEYKESQNDLLSGYLQALEMLFENFCDKFDIRCKLLD